MFKLLLLPVLCTVSVFGAINPLLQVSESGTFSNSTPQSSFTAPGETFSFSFDVLTNPAVSNVSWGNYFDAAFSNFTYTLDGVKKSISPSDIRFFSNADEGMLDICFTPGCNGGSVTNGLELFGAQLFSGSESAPTIRTGVYTPSEAEYVVNGASCDFSGSKLTIAAAPVPEPSSVVLLAGIVGLCLWQLRRRLSASV